MLTVNQRKKPKYDAHAAITTLQEQVAGLIRYNDTIKNEFQFLGKSQTGLWEAYENLQKEHQELKEKHDSLCNFLGVVAEHRQTEGVKVKMEEE